MKPILAATAVALGLMSSVHAGPVIEIVNSADPEAFVIANRTGATTIAVDPADYAVVNVAAGLFADDVERVTGHRANVTATPAPGHVIIVGTLGHSALIDGLVAKGKLSDIATIKGGWEATLWQVVSHPAPGIDRALVVVGSDRRGAAYGLMRLSQEMGVSPWYWWADVPPRQADVVAVKLTAPQSDAPAVKYRGIFINDEDWGLFPWAAKTFDPALGNIGPKTYAKVFELLLRLRLNYLWPAMHACSAEFASQPDNAKLADRFGIVAGSSHCEPMLCNNVHWNEPTQGKWDYTLNQDTIRSYWEQSTKTRGAYEAVWTLGIRGIHDRAMEGPKEIPTRLKIVSQVIADQRALLAQHVNQEWGPIAQCFVPYKEVLPIYDAGLPVPDDVTLVWVDDNFGYIRRLSAPAERSRSGGAGVYWHLSYYGSPHSYTWINTTAPGFMWEELHKAWENDARTLWVLNVGDIKPGEIGIDYFSRLAWAPAQMGPDSQTPFLREFVTDNFGASLAVETTGLLNRFYRLGTQRKPELMTRAWALGLTAPAAAELEHAYTELRQTERGIAAQLPANVRDAFSETIGFPAEVLGTSGLIFLADRKVQLGIDAAANAEAITRLRDELQSEVTHYNTKIGGGKWNRMMPGLVTGTDLTKWSSQVRWPWGETEVSGGPGAARHPSDEPAAGNRWRDAASFDRSGKATNGAAWQPVTGLGTTGRAVTLLPAALTSSWQPADSAAPRLEYDFEYPGGEPVAFLEFMPTFRIYPGMKLRVSVAVDDQPPMVVEVPGSSGAEDERGPLRQSAVQDNTVRSRASLPRLAAGRHVLKVFAVDPGVVLNRVSLP